MPKQIFGFNEKIALENKYTQKKIEVMLRIEKEKILAAKIKGEVCGCKNFVEKLNTISWNESANSIISLMPSYPYHLKLLMIQSWEKLAKKDLEISEQANYLRTILLEKERIENHLDFIIAIAQNTNYPLLKNNASKLKMNLKTVLKNDKLPLDICFGGVTRELIDNEREGLMANLPSFLKKFEKVKRNIIKNPVLKNQLEDVGIISRDEAKKLSLSGPIARGSGITIDLRKSDPYTAYNNIEFSIAVSDNCDVFGETIVRCNEIQESVNIINQLLETLPKDSCRTEITDIEIPSNNLVERLESPNGELFLFIVSQQGTNASKPKHGNIVLPSKINKQGFLARITSEYFDNIPVIIPSLGNGWK
jgi:NADH:ubiquinone oxidoreductase subunit D